MAAGAPLENPLPDPLKLGAVSVCVNYSQYLELCARNRPLFDRWVVVTTREDEQTQEVCHRHDLEVVLTDRLYENGDAFNKGKAINDGLEALAAGDWVLLIDADILLPRNFRDVLQQNELDPEFIYTCRYRALCRDLAAYERIRAEMETPPVRRKKSALTRLVRKLRGRRAYDRFMNRTVPRVCETHPVLTDAEVLDEIASRSRHCLERGPIDRLWRDPSLSDDEIVGLKRNWLERHADRDCLERNDFKAGFVQLFHSSTGRRYSEEFGTASRSDTQFFEQFSESVDESSAYSGKVTRFTLRKWKPLLVSAPLAGCAQGYLFCYHLGPIYENWDGVAPAPTLNPTP